MSLSLLGIARGSTLSPSQMTLHGVDAFAQGYCHYHAWVNASPSLLSSDGWLVIKVNILQRDSKDVYKQIKGVKKSCSAVK